MTIFARLMKAIQYIVKKADMVLLGLCLVCTAFGIVLIASATNYLESATQMRRVIIQAAGAAMGVGAYFVLSNIDMEHVCEKWWWLFFLFGLGFIAMLRWFGVGEETTGNKAWLAIPHFPVQIQPAEVVKLSYTVLLAKQLAWFRDNRRMRGLGSLVFPAGDRKSVV